MISGRCWRLEAVLTYPDESMLFPAPSHLQEARGGETGVDGVDGGWNGGGRGTSGVFKPPINLMDTEMVSVETKMNSTLPGILYVSRAWSSFLRLFKKSPQDSSRGIPRTPQEDSPGFLKRIPQDFSRRLARTFQEDSTGLLKRTPQDSLRSLPRTSQQDSLAKDFSKELPRSTQEDYLTVFQDESQIVS